MKRGNGDERQRRIVSVGEGDGDSGTTVGLGVFVLMIAEDGALAKISNGLV